MAQKLYEETNIRSIADAIRAKNGLTTTYKTSEMAAAIAAIPSGGGDFPAELLQISGNVQYMFGYNCWNEFIKHLGNSITTSNLNDCESMFYLNSDIEEIPFTLNWKASNLYMNNLFAYCSNLKVCPHIRLDTSKLSTSAQIKFTGLLRSCSKLRNADDFFVAEDLEFLKTFNPSATYANLAIGNLFDSCYSLRTVPKWFNNLQVNRTVTVTSQTMSSVFNKCYVLDEACNLPVFIIPKMTSNMFTTTFAGCYRIKNVTFETNEDGSPKVVEWKNQVIDLAGYTGYGTGGANHLTYMYNSGITTDKQVTDDATYQALKDDPDWFTMDAAYSRYNHDSAVTTINSLPDASAYLASAGGSNTIKFKGTAGSSTDGGAVNTLTEEEIAVAAAKGWTVSFA